MTDDLQPWLRHIEERTRCHSDSQFDCAALTKGEVRFLYECYLAHETLVAKGVEALNVPWPEPNSAYEHVIAANTLLKVEIAALREELRDQKEKADYLQQCGETKPALQTMYDVGQLQLKALTRQVEERDRALATQIEAYQQLEKKLVRLTGLAEDLVEEAASR